MTSGNRNRLELEVSNSCQLVPSLLLVSFLAVRMPCLIFQSTDRLNSHLLAFEGLTLYGVLYCTLFLHFCESLYYRHTGLRLCTHKQLVNYQLSSYPRQKDTVIDLKRDHHLIMASLRLQVASAPIFKDKNLPPTEIQY